jgi:hypothetical protein
VDRFPTPDPTEAYKIPLLVGVVGHRDLLVEELPALRAAIAQVLQALRAAEPSVRVKLLSSMADGADLLAADVATELGIDVVALLPFSEAQCRSDLQTDAARARFDAIMSRAERLELSAPEGRSSNDLKEGDSLREQQFARAGLILARYCSVLIAIWDGQKTGHPAGTARVVDHRRRGLGNGDSSSAEGLDPLFLGEDNDLTYEIRCSRRSTASTGQATATAGVRVLGFTGGGAESRTLEQGMPQSLRTLLKRTGEFNGDVADYRDEIARSGRRLAPPTPYAIPQALWYIDGLFKASDWLGSHFRRCFGRALATRYALWAVLAFLLLTFKKDYEGSFGLASISGVLVIFALGWALAFWAHRREWHRRFVDYRGLAEGLRVEFYWELAGVRSELDNMFAHETFLQKQDLDLEWIRAAMRSVSLRCALYPRSSWPNGFAQAFAAWIGDPDPINGSGQLQYYRLRSQALDRRQERAERIAQVMLIAGLAMGLTLAIDSALRAFGMPFLAPSPRTALVWGLALLTVYGAIFEIYLHEKADRLLIRQYRYMDSLFSFAARELRSGRSDAEKLEILRSLGHACLAEHAQWILAHRDKRIEGMRW